jgi:hypothetical protein
MTAINIVDRRTPGTPEMINDEITGGEAFGKTTLELVHEQLAGSIEPFALPTIPTKTSSRTLPRSALISAAAH